MTVHTLTTERAPRVSSAIVAGDTLVIEGAYWQVREAVKGYSPSGLQNMALTLWREFAHDYTYSTLYTY